MAADGSTRLLIIHNILLSIPEFQQNPHSADGNLSAIHFPHPEIFYTPHGQALLLQTY
jgi:hypothetical protein